MREIGAVIADDEPLGRRGIRQLLRAHPDVRVLRECRDGREALNALATLAPDLIFLDVQMPELDGFDVVAAHGPERMPAVIFVTAYDEFAVRAFDAHALDYVVKPVNAARFATALDRVRARIDSLTALELARGMADLLAARQPQVAAGAQESGLGGAPPHKTPRLVVSTATGELVLDLAEVDWIQAQDYYAAIYTRGRRHLVRESLASLEARLDPARFVRVHRSALVCIERVRELRSGPDDESMIVLRDGTRIPVSRRRRAAVGELLRRLSD
jgi:two-component system LytT family response regulator